MEQQVSTKSTALDVVIALKKATSKTNVTFVSIRSYTNKYGEIANHLINVGASYSKAKERDIEFLKNLDLDSNEFEFKSAKALLIEAKQTLIESFEKPDFNRSEGQINAYTNIIKGVKVHNQTGDIYIFGYRENKTILQEGNYPIVNSKPITIAKNELRKLLRTGKYTQYVISSIGEVRTNGETLEL
jgi:hypothetical protein